MNCLYGTPSISLMRPPSEKPNTTMKSAAEMMGASTVCVHSLDTRSVSRLTSHMSPRVPPAVTPRRLGTDRQRPPPSRHGRERLRPAPHRLRAEQHRHPLLLAEQPRLVRVERRLRVR